MTSLDGVARGSKGIFSRNFVLLCVYYFTYSLGSFVLLAIVPLYGLKIKASETEIGAAVGAVFVCALFVRILAGRAVDALPKNIFLIVGAVICAVAALPLAAIENVFAIVLLRVVYGVGYGLVLTGAYSLTADLAPPGRRGEALGYFGTSSNVAMALGPLLGIWVLERNGFSFAFLTAGVVLVVAIGMSLAIKPSKVTVATTGPFRIGLDQQAVKPSIMGILLFLTYGGLTSFLPLYVVRESLGNPGVFFSAMGLAVMALRAIAGRTSDRLSRRAVLVPGYVLLTISLAILMFTHSVELLTLAGLIYGAGVGAVQPSLMGLATDHTSPGQHGLALAMIGGAFDMGVGFGGIILGPVLQHTGFGGFYVASMLCPLAGLALAVRLRAVAAAPAPFQGG